MARFIRNQSDSNGMPPGSFVFIGKKKVDFSKISVIQYNDDELVENFPGDAEELKSLDNNTVKWINVDGIHDTDLIQKTCEIFHLHPLLTEDILNTGQRPKIEEYDNEIFVIIKMLDFDEENKIVNSEQVAIVVKKNLVITFQEQPGDVFDPVRERIRKKRGRIRTLGSDYLAYALLDTIVDNYLHIVEIIGDRIEELENVILEKSTPAVVKKINIYKKRNKLFKQNSKTCERCSFQIYKN